MAFVSDKYVLSITLADNGNNRITKTYKMRAADAISAATDAAIVVAALEAVSNSVVVTYRVSAVWQNDSWSYPAAGIENEDKASISVELSTANKVANFKIPAPVIGIFMTPAGDGANIVDVLDGDLNTYHNIFQADGEVYISDGEDSVEMLKGNRISAKRNFG